jgi:D-alanyl-D-alanine carboxypeptidase-like protein
LITTRRPDALQSLQSAVGNRAVTQLLTTIQRDTPPPTTPPKSSSATPAQPDDARDWAKSAVDKLPKKQKERFEAIEWGRLDFPGTTVPAKGLKQEEAQWWRDQPGVQEVGEGDAAIFKGAHQAEAQQLLDALASATSGGGERRVNTGPRAVLKERAFKLARDDFDKFFVDKLDATKIDGHQLNTDAAAKFRDMAAAAKKDKVTLTIGSAYRTRAQEEATAKKSTNPRAFGSFSPHAMGLAADINLKTTGYEYKEFLTGNFNKVLDMLESPVYKWLSAHASEYGFYPYSSEPWHWEYNPEGFAEHFFDDDPTLQAKIKEADDADAADKKAAADKAAAEKAARLKKAKGAKAQK